MITESAVGIVDIEVKIYKTEYCLLRNLVWDFAVILLRLL